MIRPEDLRKISQRLYSTEYTTLREEGAGWYAINSIIPRDIKPEYRKSGGGVLEHQLTDLPEAIDQCISYLHNRKEECESLIRHFENFKEQL